MFPTRTPLAYCFFLLLLLTAGSVWGQGPVPTPTPFSGPIGIDKAEIDKASKNPWNIEAEKLSYDEKRQMYTAEGNVRMTSEDRIITADSAQADMVKRKVELWGNVSVQFGRDWLKGEHVIWNIDSETGWLDNGIVFFAQSNFFVQGNSINKTGPTEYQLKEGFITSCDPSKPDWKIQYDQMTVNVGGMAWAKRSSLWADNLPVGYSPIIGVPVGTDRQSGFLFPWAGSSTLNGVTFELPYYWVINKEMDATFYERYLQNRGAMEGGEFRINNPQWGEGVWAFNYIHDEADKQFLLDKGYPFQAEDRFWLRARHDVELPWDIEAKIDLDIVSDRNFLQEFNQGSSSEYTANKMFRDYFGRGILYDYTSLVRESAIDLEKKGESTLLSMNADYFEQLQDTLVRSTVQKLPSFSFSIIPKPVGDSSVYYTLQSSETNYYRQEGDREQRLDIYPRIFYPMHWANYLDVEPSAGFRTTSYDIQWEDSTVGANSDNSSQRVLGDANVEISSRLNRDFPISLGNFVAVEHSIRPEISYEYTNQDVMVGQNAHIDQLDLNQNRNGIRYGFSTFLTAKEVKNDAEGNPVVSYQEWFRLRAFEFFNFERPFVQDPLFSTPVMREGPSPAGIRMDITPKSYVTLSYNADFDWADTGTGNSHDLFITLDDGKGSMFRVDYQERQDLQINEITTEIYYKVWKDIYLNTYHDYSIADGLIYKQGYGIRYYHGCWGIGLAYEKEGSDNRALFSIELLGMGSALGDMRYLGRPEFSEPRPEFQRPETWMLSK
jgi:LPS-assembly protein